MHTTQNIWNRKNARRSEKECGPSQTIPGESYSIAELLEKHAHGILPQVGHKGIYDDQETLDHDTDVSYRTPGFELSDITEKLEEYDELKEKIEIHRKIQNKDKKIALQKAEKAKQKEEILKEIALEKEDGSANDRAKVAE